MPTHVLVVAKAPRPGRVKTRLHPAFAPEEAARLAEAALRDTLVAVRASGADRRIVALDGPTGPWLGDDVEVVAQVDGTLNDRLAAAWRWAGGPGLQIGMDTPQVTGALLHHGLDLLRSRGVDAVLGPSTDGGWWALGLREPVGGVFDGVPMSRGDTGQRQLERLHELGLRTALLPELRDMDRPDDVVAITTDHPHLQTSSVAARLAS
jgi:rSAM/selenodomain-associated transferase 1